MSSELVTATANLRTVLAEEFNPNDIQSVLDLNKKLCNCKHKLLSVFDNLPTETVRDKRHRIVARIYLESGDNIDDAEIALAIAYEKIAVLREKIIYACKLAERELNVQRKSYSSAL